MPTLKRTLVLEHPRDEVFAFFSNPENLALLTPPNVGFQMLSDEPVEMRVGALLDYRIRVSGLPLRWTSEIEVWDPPRRFVDVQRRGPYREWRHEHAFRAVSLHLTEITDTVLYQLPLGAVGALALPLVKLQLRRIFDYREDAMREVFPGGGAQGLE